MTQNLAYTLTRIVASMKSAVCVLIMRDGKALAISRRNNHTQWGLPGGKVDAGESSAEAIVRETSEEVFFAMDFELLVPLYSDACAGSGPLDTYWVTTYLYLGEGPPIADLTPEEGMVLEYKELSELCYRDNSPFANYNLGVAAALIKHTFLGVPNV